MFMHDCSATYNCIVTINILWHHQSLTSKIFKDIFKDIFKTLYEWISSILCMNLCKHVGFNFGHSPVFCRTIRPGFTQQTFGKKLCSLELRGFFAGFFYGEM